MIREVTTADLPEEDIAQLTACLLQWKRDGQNNPMIPCDADVDGDGLADAFALNGFGKLVFVSGVALGDTVYKADGSGLEGGQS